MNAISIIIPVYNESESLEPLCGKINDIMSQVKHPYEIIFVDGGSQDGSFEKLLSLKEKFLNLRIVKLHKRCSQSLALSLGIHFSKGKTVICMDADLQNDPADIPLFLKKIDENYDIVCGWRRGRQDPALKIIISRVGNAILSKLSGMKLHDFSCTFKAFKNGCAKKISSKLFPGFHRFIPLIGRELGLSICEIETVHHQRFYGKSKYSFLKIFEAFYGYFLIVLGGRLQKDFPQDRLLDCVDEFIS